MLYFPTGISWLSLEVFQGSSLFALNANDIMTMDYKKMVQEAKKKGMTDEKMWASISVLGEGLKSIEESDPDLYWKIIRDQHKIMNDGHYSQEFAELDVKELQYTDKNGMKHTGAHWTKEEVVSATQNKTFPTGVNEWDRYVAYNAMYSDLCKKFDDSQILEAAYLFYFADEDWKDGSGTKIWDYISEAMYK